MGKLNKDQLDKIERYAQMGKSGVCISKILGLKPATVNYRMLRMGFDPWPGKRSNPGPQVGGFSREEDAAMLQKRIAGMKIHQIARELKRPVTSIRIRIMTLEVRAEKSLEAA